jgi:hypothetical protein
LYVTEPAVCMLQNPLFVCYRTRMSLILNMRAVRLEKYECSVFLLMKDMQFIIIHLLITNL